MTLTSDELLLVCIHEGGHVVVGDALCIRLTRAEVVPANPSGAVYYIPEPSKHSIFLDAQIVFLQAGYLAQDRQAGKHHAGTPAGCDDALLIRELAWPHYPNERDFADYTARMLRKTTALVELHWRKILGFAIELKLTPKMDASDIQRALRLVKARY